MNWAFGTSETPKVFFSNLAEYYLFLKGFCLVTGLLDQDTKGNWVMGPKLCREARCTCFEFNSRGEDPCSHVWMISMIFCSQKPQEDFRLLRCFDEDNNVEAELDRAL